MVVIFALGVNTPVFNYHWTKTTHDNFNPYQSTKQKSVNQKHTEYTSHKKEIYNTNPLEQIRIAIMTTGEYSQYHLKKHDVKKLTKKQQKEIVLNAINLSLQKINQIFNRDLNIQLVLAKNNDQLIFLNSETDSLSNYNQQKLILEAPLKIKKIINSNSYDIAQTLGTFKGGISSRGVAFTNRKANGITGFPTPEGKIFNIDYLSHEIAHQLGATHTQNSNCSRDKQSAVEPGSGHSIMSYAGICDLPNSNVALTSKSYFHSINIEQIHNYLNTKINKEIAPTNILEPLANYSIPLETPFEISLKTNIVNNDFLNFTCEQIDNEIAVFPPKKNAVLGPIFTSRPPNKNSIFSFPKKELVINNNFTSKYGVLSNVPRNYTFAASARNTKLGYQGTSIQKFNVKVTNSPKFEVTSQNRKNINWKSNSIQHITWSIGNTNAFPINTKRVSILLSTDNGKTFQTLLKSTPNDGQAKVSIPSNIKSDKCRIKIKAIDNIFYSLNKEMFSINAEKFIKKVSPQNSQITKHKGVIQKTIQINENFNFNDLEITLKLTHAQINDLVISIENPSKQKVILWNQNCSNEQHIDLTFKDNEQKIPWGISNLGGEICDEIVIGYRNPFESLKKLTGTTKGIWTLSIQALSTKNIIILENFNLLFKIPKTPNFDIDTTPEIEIIPNPAYEKIIIQLVDTQKSNINNIEFYKTSGELVKKVSLSNLKKQPVPIDDLLSGLYLVKIKNGETTYNQKLIVK